MDDYPMRPDQWLISRVAKLFYAQYGAILREEMHKWGGQAEDDRLIRQIKRLGSCGRDITLRAGVQILAPEQVHIGNHVGIGYNTILRGHGGITLGDFALLGDNIILATDGHPLGEVYFNNPQFKPIHIEPNVWLAAHVVVVGGVRIGENSAIGAGAVVTEDVPPNSVAVGAPARVIKTLAVDSAKIEAQKAQIRQQRAAHTVFPYFES